MRFYVTGLTQRSEVAGIKRQLLHIKGAACTLLDRAYMVYLGCYRCPTLLLAILANGVG